LTGILTRTTNSPLSNDEKFLSPKNKEVGRGNTRYLREEYPEMVKKCQEVIF
jgi:hypothetical protein